MIIITCPSCSANYRIHTDVIDPTNGRLVRCSACGNSWRIYRPKADEQDNKQKKSKNSKKSNSIILPLILIILCVNIIVFGISYLFRHDIVKNMPQTERFYELMGIETTKAGISLIMPYLEKNIHKDGETSLLIRGSFLNSHPKDTLPIPPLKIILLDETNSAIAHFVKSDFTPDTLPAGGRSDFTYEIPKLPKEAVDVRIELQTN